MTWEQRLPHPRRRRQGGGPERTRPGPTIVRPLYGSVPQTREPATYTVTFTESAYEVLVPRL